MKYNAYLKVLKQISNTISNQISKNTFAFVSLRKHADFMIRDFLIIFVRKKISCRVNKAQIKKISFKSMK